MPRSGLEDIFFMLISTEHEICPDNKSHTNSCKFFLAKIAQRENFPANKCENAKNSC